MGIIEVLSADMPRGKKDTGRRITVDGDIATVQLTCGRECIIDASDVGLVESRNWQVSGDRRYAVTSLKRGGAHMQFKMHRLILGVDDPSIFVDHINGNGLDNRRANLRTCTHGQNLMNRRKRRPTSSVYVGVHKVKASKSRWQAFVRANGEKKYLGTYYSEEDAARAREKFITENNIEFAYRNFAV